MRAIVDVRQLQLEPQLRGAGVYVCNLVQAYYVQRRDLVLLAWPGEISALPSEIMRHYPIVRVPRVPRIPGVGHISAVMDNYLLGSHYARLVKKADIVHFTHGPTLAFGYPQTDIGIPRVLTIHDIGVVRWPNLVFPGYRGFKALVYGASYRWILTRSQYIDGLIVDSHYTRGSLAEYLRCVPHVECISLAASEAFKPYTEVEARQFRQRMGLPEQYILYVGSLARNKNLHRLLQAMNQGCAWPIVLAGPQLLAERELMTSQYRNLDLRWLGYVEDKNLPGLYASAGLFVLPSLAEGFGLPAVEALACQTPLVCSNTTSLPEVVGAAAVTFSPYSADDIRNKVLAVMNDEQLRNKLRLEGRKRSAQLTWEATASATWHSYGHFLAAYQDNWQRSRGVSSC